MAQLSLEEPSPLPAVILKVSAFSPKALDTTYMPMACECILPTPGSSRICIFNCPSWTSKMHLQLNTAQTTGCAHALPIPVNGTTKHLGTRARTLELFLESFSVKADTPNRTTSHTFRCSSLSGAWTTSQQLPNQASLTQTGPIRIPSRHRN